MTFTSETAITHQLDIIGKRVEMLTAVERLPSGQHLCRCDCGNTRVVATGHFNTGKIKSCGCHKPQHGHAARWRKSREYTAYNNMIARCHKPTNKRYCDYGARGILVCDRWREKFSNFLDDMGPCPPGYTIDRIDNERGYDPDNCRWASRQQNQRNRSVSRVWVVDGREFATLEDAAAVHGVSTASIRAWCVGRVAEGRYYPPREACFAKPIYEGSANG